MKTKTRCWEQESVWRRLRGGSLFSLWKTGRKERETIAGWALQLKGEVLEKMKASKTSINRPTTNS